MRSLFYSLVSIVFLSMGHFSYAQANQVTYGPTTVKIIDSRIPRSPIFEEMTLTYSLRALENGGVTERYIVFFDISSEETICPLVLLADEGDLRSYQVGSCDLSLLGNNMTDVRFRLRVGKAARYEIGTSFVMSAPQMNVYLAREDHWEFVTFANPIRGRHFMECNLIDSERRACDEGRAYLWNRW